MGSERSTTSEHSGKSTPAAASGELGPRPGAQGSLAHAIGTSPRAAAQRAVGAQIQDSPYMAAQRAQIDALVVHRAPARAKPILQAKGMPVPDKTLDVQLRRIPPGNGGVFQRATEIAHTPDYVTVGPPSDRKNYQVGKTMTAKLDVKDPVVGTATGPNWTWMQYLRSQSPGAGVVRGHLLNHDLGGYAVDINLYPISTQANADHSEHVEQKVKGMLNAEGSKAAASHAYKRVFYAVSVAEKTAHDPSEAKFDCAWKLEDGTGAATKSIESKLSHTGKYRKTGSEKAHPSWHHGKRKGAMDITTVAGTGGKITHHALGGGVTISPNVEATYKSESKEGETLKNEFARALAYQAIQKIFKDAGLIRSGDRVDTDLVSSVMLEAEQDDEYLEDQSLATLEQAVIRITLEMLGLD